MTFSGRAKGFCQASVLRPNLARILGPEWVEWISARPPHDCRGEIAGSRPCRFVRCKHSLVGDWDKNGAFSPYYDVDVKELVFTCVHDVAEAGGISLDAIGSIMNLTHERVRQIEADALKKIHRHKDLCHD
jgi:hypothetical protein